MRKCALENHFWSSPGEIVCHQISGRVRTAIPVPLPEHASCGVNHKLVSINVPALWMPDLQGFLLVEMDHEAVSIRLCADDRVPIIMGSAEPDAPEAQRAAANVRQKALDVSRCLSRARRTQNGLVGPRTRVWDDAH